MNSIRFQDYKDQIISALEGKGYSFTAQARTVASLISPVSATPPYSLVESFINQPVQNEISKSIMIGGPSLPMIAIIDNTKGRLEFFALKAILPEIQL